MQDQHYIDSDESSAAFPCLLITYSKNIIAFLTADNTEQKENNILCNEAARFRYKGEQTNKDL